MRCAKCGGEVNPTDSCCPYCSQTRGEMPDLKGWKPEDEGGGERAGAGRRVYFKELTFSRLGIWPSVFWLVILMAVLVFALPLVIFAMLIFVVYRSLTRGMF